MQAIIIPGNGNADISQFWYPQVKSDLQKLGINVVAQNMPDPDLARRKYWVPFIKEQINKDKNAILIGHSSGVVAILRYLEENKAAGAVLIGAYHTDLNNQNEKISGYFDEPWDWGKIKKNVKWVIQFASTDDPFISIEEARYVKNKLNAEYYEFTDRGHFMETEFPELIEAIKKRLS